MIVSQSNRNCNHGFSPWENQSIKRDDFSPIDDVRRADRPMDTARQLYIALRSTSV